MSTRRISVEILADAAQFERSMAAASASAAELDTTLSRVSKQTRVNLGTLGESAKTTEGLVTKLSHSMALWLGAPALGAGLASAIRATQKFGAEMEMLHTQAGASQAEVTKMTAALQRIAPSVGTGPEDLAKGLYHIESAGIRGANAMKVLEAASKGARIGNADLEDVTNALNAVVVSGIKGAKNYEQAMGSLNATVGAGDMRMQDLADAMGTGLPARAKIFGVSLQQVNAALAVFGDNNIRGAKAGTDLASAIRLMGAPSKVAAKELAGLGLSATQLGDDMRSGGLVKAISDLKDRMDAMGLTASQQAVVLTRAFGGKQSNGILVLIDQLERLRQKVKAVGDGAQSFGANWEAYTKTSQYETQRFQAALETLRIEVGTAILPAFTQATKALADWVEKENKSGQIARDVKVALHDLVDVVQFAVTAVKALDKVTGGFEQTMETLLALRVASKLSSWGIGFSTLGTGIEDANTKAVTLKGNLANLASIGTIVIGVDLLERLIPAAVTKGGQGILNSEGLGFLGQIPLIGPVAQAGAYTGSKFGRAVGLGGTANGLPTPPPKSVPTQQYTPAQMNAYKAGLAGKAISLTGVSSSVLQAYVAGRNAGAHPISGPATQATQGGTNYRAYAAQMASLYGVPAAMFLAQINQESGFNPNAKSGAGAIGIAQFMPGTAKSMGVNPYDPKSSLEGAAKMMAQLYAKYGSWSEALSAYNSGSPTAYLNPGFAKGQTYNYVRSILAAAGMSYDTPAGGPTQSQLAALGLAPSTATAKHKGPKTITGPALLPGPLGNAIGTYATKASTAATPEDAMHWLEMQATDLGKAKVLLTQKLHQGSAAQQAATAKELAAVNQQIDHVNASLTKVYKGVADDRFANAVKATVNKFVAGLGPVKARYEALLVKANYDTGQALIADYDAIAKNLGSQKDTLTREISKLTGEEKGKDAKQRASLAAQITRIQGLLSAVRTTIQSNIQSEVNALQSSLSGLQSNTGSAWSTFSSDIVAQFQAQTTAQLAALARNPAYFQNGALTPSEAKLAAMQAQDQADSLKKTLTSAQQQLATDKTGGADQATLQADNDAVAAAQRQIDESNLATQAAKERAAADQSYADAVQKLTDQRTLQESELTKVLGQFGVGLQDGSVSLSDLQGWLNGANPEGWSFGLNLDAINQSSPLVKSDFDDLSASASALVDAFVALINFINQKTGAGVPVPGGVAESESAKLSKAVATAAAHPTKANIAAAYTAAQTAGYTQSLGFLTRAGVIPSMAVGGRILSDGLIYGHAGETVVPASVSSPYATPTVHVTIEKVYSLTRSPGDARELAKAIQPHLNRIVSYSK